MPRNWEHLIRLAAVVAGSVGAFLVIRAAVVPTDFGRLGHYRPAALDDNRARPAAYAGRADCIACHDDKDTATKTGRHAKISCEACHGAQAVHASDPEKKPSKPQAAALCKGCHQKDAAKPAWFPQVAVAEHYADAGTCIACHNPHQPKM
ncbi:MAG: cytochrome c3 family protein [Bryobacteraceae bacterium]